MPTYTYEVLNPGGKRSKGKVEADSRNQAIDHLKEQGRFIIKVAEVQDNIWTRDLEFGRKKVKAQEFVVFCRQFATLIRAGVALVDALKVMEEQAESKRMRAAIHDITTTVVRGNTLSSGLAEHPDVFSPIFIHMVRVGEVSGNLETVLDNLANYMERQRDTIEKLKSSMMYPVFVIVFAIGVVIFLLTKVIPVFVGVFQQENLTLPLATRIVIGMSHTLISQWYLFVAAVVVLILFFFYLFRTRRGRYQWDKFKLRIPLLGTLFLKSSVARLSRVLGMLFGSAVPALQSFSITANIVDNLYIREALLQARDSIGRGRSIAEPFQSSGIFPALVTQMVVVGEHTGNLEVMFTKIADFYESDVDYVVTRLRTMMEPVLIAILAVVVGSIILAALMPMFTLYQSVNQLS